jgi:2'-5' RNA ligase
MEHKLFVSIPLPDFIKELLSSAQQTIKNYLPESRLSSADNLHITIQFIGFVDAKSMPALIILLNKIEMRQFHIFLEKLELKHQREHDLIWCTVKAQHLEHLAQRMRELLIDFTQPVTRTFNGHITIARFKQNHPDISLEQCIKNYTFDEVFFTADRFCLMESKNSPAGISYQILSSYPLL